MSVRYFLTTRGGKIAFLSISMVNCWWSMCMSCSQICLYTLYVCLTPVLWLVSSQKLPSAGGRCVCVSIFTLHLSFHAIAVGSSITLVFMWPHFSFRFLFRIPRGSFLIWYGSTTVIYGHVIQEMKINCPWRAHAPHFQYLQSVLSQLHVWLSM